MNDTSGQQMRRGSIGRIAGIDFGTVRLGIAIADAEVRIASPLENYTRRSTEADASRFRRLVAEENVTRFVVGLPVHLGGGESPMSAEARRFATWLHETTSMPVDLFDERFTTREAEDLLLEAGLTRQKRKARLDMLAAQTLLTAYLESGCRGDRAPRSLDD